MDELLEDDCCGMRRLGCGRGGSCICVMGKALLLLSSLLRRLLLLLPPPPLPPEVVVTILLLIWMST
jgi:hypothetical protein